MEGDQDKLRPVTCEICVFFRVHREFSGVGTCRFNPPVANGNASSFPVVNFNDWCREFRLN